MHNIAKRAAKVVILAIDGMDPVISERLMQDGLLPNLAELRREGMYQHLQTTMPTETVVAWSSFVTGRNPGEHGIFDFIMRKSDYTPYLSLNEIVNKGGRIAIRSYRKQEAFWQLLSRQGITSQIYFCPNTFPPERLRGKMLSGMGTPDITGTMGKYAFYSNQPDPVSADQARGRFILIAPRDSVARTFIYGPKKTQGKAVIDCSVPLTICTTPDKKAVICEFQGRRVSLGEKEWSNWQKVSFKTGFLKRVDGIFRFYLVSAGPNIQLYLSPINFDPRRPVFPISYPSTLSAELVKKVGLYYTQGMPIDTWALTDGRISEAAFLQQVDLVLKEQEAILKAQLENYKAGVFFGYIEALDMIQHMFWRYIDPQHPLYENNPTYKKTIDSYYVRMDDLIGKVRARAGNNLTLMVLSDHGFSSFRRAVHLNTWLWKHKYLAVSDNSNRADGFLEGIDWRQTKAYALGFGGIYINKGDRELGGILSPKAAKDTAAAIAAGLSELVDPQTGERVVKRVYLRDDIFQGANIDQAPDLVVGFNAGYRASWQTALGGVPDVLIEDNLRKWSGDHLVDRDLVPGVFFSNRRIKLPNDAITDIAPLIVELAE